jgi:hypothetical protein
MPSRLPNLGWAPRVALITALLPLLAECGPIRNQFAPPCPRPAFLGDAADLDLYQPGSTRASGPGVGRDLSELVLHARIAGVNGSCREGDKKSQLPTAVEIVVELSRGPAMQGREADVPVFLAVAEGETILDKQVYLMHVTFPPNQDRVTLGTGQLDLVLPVSPTRSGAAYSIIAGFQLTPEQLEQARRNRKP